jgi:hypothetical protein
MRWRRFAEDPAVDAVLASGGAVAFHLREQVDAVAAIAEDPATRRCSRAAVRW